MEGAPTRVARGLRGIGGSDSFEALSDRRFRVWFVSQVISASGNTTQAVGVSWLVLSTTHSAIDLSLVGVCTFAPSFVFAPWGGAIAQRRSRRGVLVVTQLCLLVISLALFTLYVADIRPLWLLLAASLTGGVANAFDGPARQLFVRDLVGGAGVASAVSLTEIVINGARVFGPALGGLLLALRGPGACFLANGLSFLAPLAVLLVINPAHLAAVQPPARPRRAIRRAVRYVGGRPDIITCLGLAVALGMVFNAGTLLPLMTREVLHRGGASYGSLLTAFGLGAIPGALMAGRSGVPRPAVVGRLSAATACAVLVTARSVSYPMMLVGEVVIGFTSIWTIAAANTMVQLRTSGEMRGPVMGLWVMAIPGAYPLTGLLAGAVAQTLGARDAFSLAGVALGLVILAGRRALVGPQVSAIAAEPNRT